MSKKEYFELYKDPRWQKKRLEILERDRWECQWCGEKENTLHVHHNYYEKGKKPWEYNIKALVTICVGCHENETFGRSQAEAILLEVLRRKGFSVYDVEHLADSFETGSDHG